MGRAGASSAVVGRGKAVMVSWRRRLLVVGVVGLTGSLALASTPADAKPAAVQGIFDAVSCTGPSACVAVGSWVGGGSTLTLAEVWNGTSWTVQTTPNPAGGSDNVLSGVSCTSSSNCLAVGSYFGGHGEALLAEHWNGTAWAIETVPLPEGGLGGAFTGVSCSGTNCTAVGDYADSGNQNESLAESWNGTTFATETVPVPGDATTNTLNAVSCSPAPSSHCEAVGWYFISGATEVAVTLAEGWNGSAWSIQSTPEPPDAGGGSYPTGMSCTAPRACTSVGEAYDDSGTPVFGWAQHWNGTAWANQNLRSPKGAIDSFPAAASCTTPATPCTTVGDFGNGSMFVSLAEGRTGARWKPQRTPTPKGSTAVSLGGVSCLSATDCIAVGYASNSSSVPLTLAESWNGTKWTVEKTPVL